MNNVKRLFGLLLLSLATGSLLDAGKEKKPLKKAEKKASIVKVQPKKNAQVVDGPNITEGLNASAEISYEALQVAAADRFRDQVNTRWNEVLSAINRYETSARDGLSELYATIGYIQTQEQENLWRDVLYNDISVTQDMVTDFISSIAQEQRQLLGDWFRENMPEALGQNTTTTASSSARQEELVRNQAFEDASSMSSVRTPILSYQELESIHERDIQERIVATWTRRFENVGDISRTPLKTARAYRGQLANIRDAIIPLKREALKEYFKLNYAGQPLEQADVDKYLGDLASRLSIWIDELQELTDKAANPEVYIGRQIQRLRRELEYLENQLPAPFTKSPPVFHWGLPAGAAFSGAAVGAALPDAITTGLEWATNNFVTQDFYNNLWYAGTGVFAAGLTAAYSAYNTYTKALENYKKEKAAYEKQEMLSLEEARQEIRNKIDALRNDPIPEAGLVDMTMFNPIR